MRQGVDGRAPPAHLSSFNHEGDEQHTWDFRRQCGTPVLAARAGTVRAVEEVRQGDRLANVGNVGNSLTGNIHFVVESGGRSMPVAFRDVEKDSGIPRTFESYKSGNGQPGARAPMARTR